MAFQIQGTQIGLKRQSVIWTFFLNPKLMTTKKRQPYRRRPTFKCKKAKQKQKKSYGEIKSVLRSSLFHSIYLYHWPTWNSTQPSCGGAAHARGLWLAWVVEHLLSTNHSPSRGHPAVPPLQWARSPPWGCGFFRFSDDVDFVGKFAMPLFFRKI